MRRRRHRARQRLAVRAPECRHREVRVAQDLREPGDPDPGLDVDEPPPVRVGELLSPPVGQARPAVADDVVELPVELLERDHRPVGGGEILERPARADRMDLLVGRGRVGDRANERGKAVALRPGVLRLVVVLRREDDFAAPVPPAPRPACLVKTLELCGATDHRRSVVDRRAPAAAPAHMEYVEILERALRADNQRGAHSRQCSSSWPRQGVQSALVRVGVRRMRPPLSPSPRGRPAPSGSVETPNGCMTDPTTNHRNMT